MMRKVWNLSSATLLATAMCLLVIPPEIAVAGTARLTPVDVNASQALVPELDAGFPPAGHDFAFRLPDLGVEIKVLKFEGGFLFWQDGEPDKWGFLPDSDLERVQIEATESGAQDLAGRFTWNDSLGAPVVYELAGDFDGVGRFHGRLSAPESGISHAVDLIWAEERFRELTAPADLGADVRNVSNRGVIIIITLSAAVLAVVSCGTLAYLEECGSDCVESCGEDGVSRWEEGTCGTCECECKDGDGGILEN